MKNVILISTITIILFSCKIQKDALYGKCGKHYFACTQILLKEDGEFEYFQFYDVGGATVVKGHWQTQNDTVTLNTYEQEENRLDTVIESRVNNQKNTIKFEGGFWGYVDIDSTKFNLNVGQQTIELDRPLKNIVFFFFDNHGSYVPLKYNIKDPFTNHLQVKVRGLKLTWF
jgi:hypothetical protein